jgi:hypothetical protein
LVVRDGALLAQQLDVTAGRLTGEPKTLAEGLNTTLHAVARWLTTIRATGVGFELVLLFTDRCGFQH